MPAPARVWWGTVGFLARVSRTVAVDLAMAGLAIRFPAVFLATTYFAATFPAAAFLTTVFLAAGCAAGDFAIVLIRRRNAESIASFIPAFLAGAVLPTGLRVLRMAIAHDLRSMIMRSHASLDSMQNIQIR